MIFSFYQVYQFALIIKWANLILSQIQGIYFKQRAKLNSCKSIIHFLARVEYDLTQVMSTVSILSSKGENRILLIGQVDPKLNYYSDLFWREGWISWLSQCQPIKALNLSPCSSFPRKHHRCLPSFLLLQQLLWWQRQSFCQVYHNLDHLC